MKPKLDCVLVVEGTQDAALISSLYDVCIVTTNGYECPKAEIDFLNRASRLYPIVILTDSDEAGESIRDKLTSINNSQHVRVDPSKCDRRNKHGVAECDIYEIKRVLSRFSHQKTQNLSQNIELNDLANIGLDKAKREYVATKLSLGKCNSKTFIKRVNLVGITLDNIKDVLSEYDNR